MWTLKKHMFVCAFSVLASHVQGQTLQPLWELGGAGAALSQQAYPGANYQQNAVLITPYLLYRGEFLRANRDGVGLRAIKSKSFELDIGVSGSLGSKASANPARQGMPNLGTLGEIGPNARWFLNDREAVQSWRFDLPLRGVFNASRQLRYEGLALEPQVVVESKPQSGWRYSASVGVLFGNASTQALYYGVDSAYATASRPAYRAKGGVTAYKAGATLTYAVTPDVSVFGFARLNTVSGSRNHASPLVQKNGGATYGIGVAYVFAKSLEMVAH